MQLNHVNHISASVRDLDRSIEFYRDLTGGELENEGRGNSPSGG
ncbi:VOC family protein [Chlorogloeopsis sp. ULAP01]|jgi:catechol 2,3-dioxygenase-like lactoylglutathione lyase family enzyme|nr:VOC family protein [Chlorogloeopsis sp. ULAP01]MDM9384658.1 VOC family protein [Chlorogloeopsis sp. ULAP01]